MVTTEGDEVEMACALSSFEAYGHNGNLSVRVGVREFGFVDGEESGSRVRANAHSCDKAA